MCGIMGKIGIHVKNDLLHGLLMLEYRGYDSTGISLWVNDQLQTFKSIDSIQALGQNMQDIDGNIGIAHTRWATHGQVNITNAHPHYNKYISIVHNGIIENLTTLQPLLGDTVLQSETDSEYILQLLTINYLNNVDNLTNIKLVASMLVGAFAILVIFANDPGVIYMMKYRSPLFVGKNNHHEYIIASDVIAFDKNITDVADLPDSTVASVSKQGTILYNITDGSNIDITFNSFNYCENKYQLNGFDSFMKQEIHAQVPYIQQLLHRFSYENLEEQLNLTALNFNQIKNIKLIACGSSFYAAMMGKYYLQTIFDLPISVELASEVQHSIYYFHPSTLIVALSQSGETADLLIAIRQALASNCQVLALCNRLESTLCKLAHNTIYLDCGYEISVAATKSFTAMVLCLYMLMLAIAKKLQLLNQQQISDYLKDLSVLNTIVKNILIKDHEIEKVVQQYINVQNMLYIGRYMCYPIALEGALKLKEISYIHAEGIAGGELKHGSLAMIDENFHVLALATQDSTFDKMLANILEIKARKGIVIGIGNKDSALYPYCNAFIDIKQLDNQYLNALVPNVILQLFAYFFAKHKGLNIDRPRNLAKSVTVE